MNGLNLDNVTFVESPQVAQFQSEVTNALIRDLSLYRTNDWIFVLDIDEFLPFTSRDDLNNFLRSHSQDKAIAFNWRNGVGIYPTGSREIKDEDSLADIEPLFVSKYDNPCIKVAINCNKVTYPFLLQNWCPSSSAASNLLIQIFFR